jgi:Ulp1 family protease
MLNENNNSIYVFPTTFFQSFGKSNFKTLNNDSKLSRWLNKIGLINAQLVLMPICYVNHWRLITFDINSSLFRYYDTRYKNSTNLMEFASFFIKIFIKTCVPSKLNNLDKWKQSYDTKFTLKQANNDDCGVFLLMICRSLTLNTDFNFDLNSVNDFRLQINKEILKQQIDLDYKFNLD